MLLYSTSLMHFFDLFDAHTSNTCHFFDTYEYHYRFSPITLSFLSLPIYTHTISVHVTFATEEGQWPKSFLLKRS